MPSNAEIFIEHLQNVFGVEDAIHKADAADGGMPISVFVYKNIPEPGMITGVTYGLSHCAFPAWKFSRPEMIIAVNSLDLDWPLAAAEFVAFFRGKKTFQFGAVFTTDEPLAPDTKMDSLLVFGQSILDEEYVSVQLNDYKIHFSQFYPIYRKEIPIYEKLGLEAFWKHKDFDMYDVTRNPIEK